MTGFWQNWLHGSKMIQIWSLFFLRRHSIESIEHPWSSAENRKPPRWLPVWAQPAHSTKRKQKNCKPCTSVMSLVESLARKSKYFLLCLCRVSSSDTGKRRLSSFMFNCSQSKRVSAHTESATMAQAEFSLHVCFGREQKIRGWRMKQSSWEPQHSMTRSATRNLLKTTTRTSLPSTWSS